MTKYDLKNYKRLKDEIIQLEDQILFLKEQMLSPKNQIINGMPRGGSGNGDKIAEMLCRVESLENKYINKCNTLLSKCEQIESVLDKLEVNERLLIRYKYMQGMKWSDIAKKMNYSEDNIYKIHGKILKKLLTL